jgi:rhodanese-related sulfurtransferase
MALAALISRPELSIPATAMADAGEHPLLQHAREQGQMQNLRYSGNIPPATAWQLIEQQAAILVDVRTAEERKFVGYVPGSLHLPWLIGTAMQTNPRFVRELEAKAPKNAVVLLLCRSGARSEAAAAAAARAGFHHVYNVLEGFEGGLDENGHRGTRDGWRFRGLRWLQE